MAACKHRNALSENAAIAGKAANTNQTESSTQQIRTSYGGCAGCIKALAGSLAKALAREGFTVHRYDAEKTDSVYLRLDWGACNTVRVSDHAGYRHAANRYNIGPWIQLRMATEDTYPRFYWPIDDAEDLIEKCKADRDARIGWSGRGGYDEIVAKKRKEAKKSRSTFWERARRVRP